MNLKLEFRLDFQIIFLKTVEMFLTMDSMAGNVNEIQLGWIIIWW